MKQKHRQNAQIVELKLGVFGFCGLDYRCFSRVRASVLTQNERGAQLISRTAAGNRALVSVTGGYLTIQI